MAQQIKKKFIGDKQVDGSKILLEDVKSVKVKDSTSTEIDLIKLNVADQVVISNDVILEGDLTVQGAITSIESATLQVTDANVVVNKDGNLASADSAGAGITVEMTDATDAAVSFDSSLASKFKIGEVGAQHQIVSTAHAQALTNKTIDADSNTISNLEVDNLKSGVLDTDLSSVSISDDTIPSAKAVKSYVDSEVSAAQGAVDAVEDDVSHLVTLSGVAVDSDDLGSFTGSTISDNQTVKAALQDLESAHEEVDANVNDLISLSGVAENDTDLGTFTGTTIPDEQTIKQALQALETAVESVSGGGSSTQLELDDTQVGAGLEVDGSYVAPAVSNYLSAATSLKDADSKLDTAISTLDSEKVDKAGDTMTGTLIINPVSGNAAEFLQNLTIGIPSWGPNYIAIAMKDGSSKQFYAGTGDQLGAFAGTASKRVLLASGFTSGATSGLVQVTSGDAEVSGNSGMVDIFSGRALGGVSGLARLSSGLGGSSSGAAQVLTGTAQNTGAIQIISGNASAGNSGNIELSTGTATVTRGNILINAPQMSFQNLGRITNLQDAVSAQDAVTKSQLDAHINDASGAHAASAISVSPVGNLAADDVQEALQELQGDIDSLNALQDDYVVLDGSRPMTGNLNMMPSLGVHNKVVGLGDPTDPRDAANKQYVDAIAEGLHVHAPAKLLASADLGGTYDNGVSGVGAFLDLSASPVASIDGVSSFSVGDRIIVAFQNGSNLDAENGIYYIADSADIDGNGDIIKLTRALDFNTPTEMAGGDFIFVQSGSQYANTGWVMSETVATVGTTPVKFVQFSGAGTYSAGDALDLTGTEFSVRVDNTTIVVNASNDLEVAPSVMSDLANKVSKTGDTMTGTLTMDSGVGNTVNVYDQGVEVVSGGFVTNVYSGEVELGYSDGTILSSVVLDASTISISNTSTVTGDISSLQILVATNSSTLIQVANDSVNEFIGQSDLSASALDFVFTDQSTGMQSTTSYQHNLISIQQNDGVNSSSFTVTPGVSVELLSNGAAVTPTADAHLAPKKYVDDNIAAHVNEGDGAHNASAISLSPDINGQSDVQSALEDHESRIDSLEGALQPTWGRIKFDLTATDISNGYVNLPHEAVANSIHAFVDRLAIHQDEDFLVSIVSGVTRITFAGDLVAPSESQLDATDNIYVRYQYLA